MLTLAAAEQYLGTRNIRHSVRPLAVLLPFDGHLVGPKLVCRRYEEGRVPKSGRLVHRFISTG